MTRFSTPKYEVVNQSGAVGISGVSKIEANKIARAMNKGAKPHSKVYVVPVKKQGLTNNVG